MFNKLKKLFSSQNKSHSGSYTSEQLNAILNYCTNVNVKSKVKVIEHRELIIGKNVKIGRNVKLYCCGGMIIGDNVTIGDNVSIGNSKIVDYLQSEKCSLPILIPANSVIQNNSDLDKLNFNDLYESNSKEIDLFFVFSTGRSGSNAFAKIFSAHPNVECRHESFFLFNRLSALVEHKKITNEQVKNVIHFLFTQLTLFSDKSKIYGESDQKLVSFISILKEILPHAKFIWLIRNAENFVASAYGRGWFDDHEYALHNKLVFSVDSIAPKEIFDDYRLEYSLFRLNGFKTGELSENVWKDMPSFDRNCWYWSFWNQKIENDWKTISDEKKYFLPLESLSENKNKILEFLNLSMNEIQTDKFNEASYEKFSFDKWTKEQKSVFEKWCGVQMKRWYKS